MPVLVVPPAPRAYNAPPFSLTFPVNSPPVAYSVPVNVAPVAVNVPSFFTVKSPPALIKLLDPLPFPIIVIFLAVTAPFGVTVKFADESPPVVSLPAQKE